MERRPFDRPKSAAEAEAHLGHRQQLKVSKKIRDLAMFNCTLDAKLRACDLVRLRVSDVAPGGALRQRSITIQQKTGRPVPFVYEKPGNLRACQLLLGHRKLESIVRYLGIEVGDALEMSEQIDL
ncbi:site-specific recombinase XerC [Brevundimonas sp. 1080]